MYSLQNYQSGTKVLVYTLDSYKQNKPIALLEYTTIAKCDKFSVQQNEKILQNILWSKNLDDNYFGKAYIFLDKDIHDKYRNNSTVLSIIKNTTDRIFISEPPHRVFRVKFGVTLGNKQSLFKKIINIIWKSLRF